MGNAQRRCEQAGAVAIIGTGAILPGATGTEQVWQQILAGADRIGEVPAERWPVAEYYDPDPAAPDKTYCRIGAFVRDFTFDCLGFRIPPRVAASMDVVQQWTLTATRELLQNSGYLERDFDRDRTAVLIGNAQGGEQKQYTNLRILFPEFSRLLRQSETFSGLTAAGQEELLRELSAGLARMLPAVTEDSMPGELSNVISGRVASAFNLRGASFTVDAACASSLAALQAAVDGLLHHRFDLVITGGVDRSMDPPAYVKFSKIGALSAEGSFPYDRRASGFVMGEGVCLFLLERLEDARKNKDRVLAVLRGLGASSDGKGKGITAPNPAGQTLALQRAYAAAGLQPDDVDLLEGHGTSTPVGDAAEIRSMIQVFGDRPAGRPLWLGSIKSQIGHLKSAAGAAGLLKAVLALDHKVLPPTLHCEQPIPELTGTPFSLVTAAAEWPRRNGPRRAGVSSFGFGGTNFHVLLEEEEGAEPPVLVLAGEVGPRPPGGQAGQLGPGGPGAERLLPRDASGEGAGPGPERLPAREDASTPASGLLAPSSGLPAAPAPGLQAPCSGLPLLALGAEDRPALIRRLRELAAHPPAEILAASGRPPAAQLRQPVRLVTTCAQGESIQVRLLAAARALEEGDTAVLQLLERSGLFCAEGEPGRLAFLFPGQGSQYPGMLQQLYLTEPVVRGVLDEAERIVSPRIGGSLLERIFPAGSGEEELLRCEAELRRTEVTQPAVFAADVALLRLLQAQGFEPDLVLGHSLGEYAALVAAGVLDLADGLVAVSARGREMARLQAPDPGQMASVEAPVAVVERVLAGVPGYVIAANLNSPTQTVIAGESAAVEQARQQLSGLGHRTLRLPVDHAFHTRIVAPAEEPLRRLLSGLPLRRPRRPVVSNLTGDLYPEQEGAVPELLARQISSPVQFMKGVQRLWQLGARCFLEVGPRRVLTSLVRDILAGSAAELGGEKAQVMFTNHPRLGDLPSLGQALAFLHAVQGPRAGRAAESGRLEGDRGLEGGDGRLDLPGPDDARARTCPGSTTQDFSQSRRAAKGSPLASAGVQQELSQGRATAEGGPQASAGVQPELSQSRATAEGGPQASAGVQPEPSQSRATVEGGPQASAGVQPELLQGRGAAERSTQGSADVPPARPDPPQSTAAPGSAGLPPAGHDLLQTTAAAEVSRPREQKEGVEVIQGRGPAPRYPGDPSTPIAHPSARPEILVTGTALGLPGCDREVFAPDGEDRLFAGENFLDPVPLAQRRSMVDLNITRLVKDPRGGGGRFETLRSEEQVARLAGQRGRFEVDPAGLLDARLLEDLDITSRLAVRAALLALREAGLPLVRRRRTTRSGVALPGCWGLPEALGAETGVIFASAFPGCDSLIREVSAHQRDRVLRELLGLVEQELGERAAAAGPGLKEALEQTAGELERVLTGRLGPGYRFDRSFIFRVLPLGHAQLAQLLGLRGPAVQLNTACASTTSALALAEDWLRLGRCRRVLLVAGDDVTSETLLPWFGGGFLALGAATTEERPELAALPFDRRRKGLVLGMGAAALVLETGEAAAERGEPGLARLLACELGNSAFHGSRPDPDHMGELLERLLERVEREQGLRREQLPGELLFVSHEPYTPARGGSAAAEAAALRQAFGGEAARIVVANTKGFTGHPMGVGIEDVVAVKALQRQEAPPVAHLREPDTELGPLTFSRGGPIRARHALRLAAGFGSQLSLALLERAEGERDEEQYARWLGRVAGAAPEQLEVVAGCLRVREGVPGPDLGRRALSSGSAGDGRPGTSPGLVVDGGPGSGDRPEGLSQSRGSLGKDWPVTSPGLIGAGGPGSGDRPEGLSQSRRAAEGNPSGSAGLQSARPDPSQSRAAAAGNPPGSAGVLPARPDPSQSRATAEGNPPGSAGVLPARPDLSQSRATAEGNPPGSAGVPPAPPVRSQSGMPGPTLEAAPLTDPSPPADLRPLIDPSPPADQGPWSDPGALVGSDPGAVEQGVAAAAAAPGAQVGVPCWPPSPGSTAPTLPPRTHQPAPVPEAVLDRLLQLVAEQTGYPAEMLDPSMDLEADLGIDTVKQAELLASLRAGYGLQRIEDLRIADYPTLNHVAQLVCSLLEQQLPGARVPAGPDPGEELSPGDSGAATVPSGPARPTPYPVSAAAGTPALPGPAAGTSALPGPGDGTPALPGPADGTPALPGPAGSSHEAVLARLLQLVAEQTGYPAEMLDPAMDLEADLGIDTVKQAELLASLRAEYGLQRIEDLRIADYPTLNHVARLVGSLLEQQLPGARVESAVPAGPRPGEELSPGDTAVTAGATPGPTRPPARPTPAPASAAGNSPEPVLTRLLQLVAEQTGYPAEMLDPAMDLEADLGIDTVKQAELLAALRGEYGLQRIEDLRIADYPTLNHVARLVGSLLEQQRPGNTELSGAPPDAPDPPPLDPAGGPLPEGAPLRLRCSAREWLTPVAGQAGQLESGSPTGPEFPGLPATRTAPASGLQPPASAPVTTSGLPATRTAPASGLQPPASAQVTTPDLPATRTAPASDLPPPASGQLTTPGLPATRTAPASGLQPPASGPVTTPDLPASRSASSLRSPASGQTPSGIRRLVPELAPLPPLDHRSPPRVQLEGAGVLLVCGPDAWSAALARGLTRRGAQVRQLVHRPGGGERVEVQGEELLLDLGEPAAVRQAVSLLRAGGLALRGVVLLPPPDEPLPGELPEGLAGRLRGTVLGAFLLARELQPVLEAGGAHGSFWLSLTRLGGHHGIGRPESGDPVAGAVTGLTKALAAELEQVHVVALDLSPHEPPATAARAVLGEILHGDGRTEVGLCGQERRTVRLAPWPLATDLPPLAAYGPGSLFLITGAARGVTAQVTLDLARHFRPRLVLLDRVKLPGEGAPTPAELESPETRQRIAARLAAEGERPTPVRLEQELEQLRGGLEARQLLEQLAACGASVEYHCVDVTDGQALAELLADIEARLGQADVVIHGAGIEQSRALARKDPATFARVLAVKAEGALNLLYGLSRIGTLVLFASVAGRFGNRGQTDYCAANDLLIKLAHLLDGTPRVGRALALAWTGWQDTGMTRRGSTGRLLEEAGVTLLPPEEGVPVVRSELLCARGQPEVVIAGALGLLDRQGTVVEGEGAAAALEAGRRVRGETGGSPFPLGGQVLCCCPGERAVLSRTLDPGEDLYLADHAIRGVPYFPGVFALESFAEAARLVHPLRPLAGFRRVEFSRPVKLHREKVQVLRTTVAGRNGLLRARLETDFTGPDPAAPPVTRLHFQAEVLLGEAPQGGEERPHLDLSPYDKGKKLEARELREVLFHGPSFRVCTALSWLPGRGALGSYSPGEGPLLRSLPEPTFLALPLLVELGFQTAALLQHLERGQMGLPWQIDRLDYLAPPPGEGVVCLASDGPEGMTLQIADRATGRVCLVISGYRTR